MTTTEIRAEIEKAENGKITGEPRAIASAFGVLAKQIRNGIYNSWCRAEARELATRAEAISEKHYQIS